MSRISQLIRRNKRRRKERIEKVLRFEMIKYTEVDGTHLGMKEFPALATAIYKDILGE